jgi:hypothetical protein
MSVTSSSLRVWRGFSSSPLYFESLIASRQLRITWGLADALDLMVITMEAGLGLNAAMLRVCDELKTVHPDISKEFELANLEIRVGRERSEALRNLADRTGVEDLNSLVAMLIQADRFGTSIARAGPSVFRQPQNETTSTSGTSSPEGGFQTPAPTRGTSLPDNVHHHSWSSPAQHFRYVRWRFRFLRSPSC